MGHGPGQIWSADRRFGTVITQIELPTDQPIAIIAGCAVAFWGVALLSAAVPSLACVPTLPRALRLGSLGVRVAAALVGLTTGVQMASASVFLSLGVVLACGVEQVVSAWIRSRSRCGTPAEPFHLQRRLPLSWRARLRKFHTSLSK